MANFTPEQQAVLDAANAKLAAQENQNQNALDSFSPEQQAILKKAQSKIDINDANQNASFFDILKQGVVKGAMGVGDILKARSNFRRELAGQEPIQTPTEFAKEKGWIVPEYEPKKGNFAQNVANLTGELIGGGGINPFSAGRTLLNQGLTQAGKQIAGQFARTGAQSAAGAGGLTYAQDIGVTNPYINAAATILPMAGVGALTSLRSAPASIARESVENITPQQIKQAQMLQSMANAYKTPLTTAEAIAQVTGSSPLQNVQRVVEQSKRGGPILSEMMVNRPKANAELMNLYTTQLGGQPSSQVPILMKDIATDVVKGAESSLTANTRPYYRAAVEEMRAAQNAGKEFMLPQVFNEEVNALVKSNPAIKDALNHVTSNEYTGAFKAAKNSPESLIAAKKYLDAQYTKFSDRVSGNLDKEKAANAWSGSRELDAFLSQKSPEYAKGSQIYESAQKTQIQPLKQGGIGVMAEQTGTPEQLMQGQREVLMPTNPAATFKPDIERMVDLLRRRNVSQNPMSNYETIIPSWTGQSLRGLYNQASKDIAGGANQFGGAKFAVQIAGNPQQKENLFTLLEKGSGQQAKQTMGDILDIFSAQGKRQPAGSMTEYNKLLNEQVGTGGLIGEVATAVTKPSTIRRWYENLKYGQNTEALANLLRDPEGVKKLIDMAKKAPESAKSQAIINTLIGGLVSQEKE